MSSEVYTQRDNFGVVASVLEAVIFLTATLLLCGLYLTYGRSVPIRGWLILFSLGIPLLLMGAIWASFISARRAALRAQSTLFRINPQLILTLEAEGVPADIRPGLEEIMEPIGEYIVEGEDRFQEVLEDRFGAARAAEGRAPFF